jgi:curli biogenesis system outer membrane secretion channel CsgG
MTWTFKAALAAIAITIALGVSAPEAPAQTPLGPKRTLSVVKFDANGAFVQKYGGWDIGGGLAAMLATELEKTGRFILVDRADLDSVLKEKELSLSGLAQTAGGERQLLPAQLLVRGSVTQFDEQEKGGGLSLGVGSNALSGALGRRGSTGSVTIDLKVVDAANGVVVSTYTVRKQVSASSMALRAGYDDIALSGDRFNQSSLGQATREAIAEAAQQIVARVGSVAWRGMVARVDGDRAYINAGRNANISEGSQLRAIRTVNTITDPATGEVLGAEESTIGDMVVEQVEDRYSVARYSGHHPLQRGDVVLLLPATAP